VRAAHLDKERGMPTHIPQKDRKPEQIPKRPHRGQYTVHKNKEKCHQHPKGRQPHPQDVTRPAKRDEEQETKQRKTSKST